MEEQQSNTQEAMPLFSGLLAYAASRPLQFHIPGHKQGAGMAPEFREFLGSNALSKDLVNVPPVDDLHRPRGMIKEAQALAAEAFGADHTFFSVQGTSGAIMAMILACVRPGEKILIPRNVHRAVMTGIVLSGAVPEFMTPEIATEFGVAHGVSVSTVRRALGEHPDARALLVVNPTYFGVVSDLRAIVEVAHERDVPVLVDEAHGAHLYFHPSLPLSAMAAGADVAATSMHKLGGSLTQSSVLNVRAGLVNPQRIQAVLSMLTTTSTSYLLLASLDAARKQLATRGCEMLDGVIALAEWARDEINAIPGLCCLGRQHVGSLSSSYGYDPTKLFISVKGLGLSGPEVEQLLRVKYRIEIEMSDLYNILALITLADNDSPVKRLGQAVREIAEGVAVRRPRLVHVRLPDLPRLALTPREAFYRYSEAVLLADSAGRIAAEFVIVYPPGIP